MAKRTQIVRFLDERLDIGGVEDYSVNGLQVEGDEEVTRVACATDAAMAVYRVAAELSCQMIFAHHGIIWGGGIRRVTGRDREHLGFLFDNNISLYAAHLPLDIHPEVGNSVGMAKILGLLGLSQFGTYHGVPIGFCGNLPKPMELGRIAEIFKNELGGEQVELAFGPKEISSVAVVAGGGSGTLKEAVAKGIDCFVTGEGKHEDHHLALEGGINALYIGHYQSETLGVKAVGKELEENLGVETVFIDEPTVL